MVFMLSQGMLLRKLKECLTKTTTPVGEVSDGVDQNVFQESTWTGMTPYCVGRITAVCLGGEGEAEEDPKENKGAGEEVNIKGTFTIWNSLEEM